MIFETPHGSRLYGLHHENSDFDRFEVYADDRPMRQRTDGKWDVTTVGLATFLEYAYNGSHQAVEALYSRQKTYHRPEYAPLVENMVIMPGGGVRNKFLRTIKKFSFGDFKRRRHAVRLGFMLSDIESGRRGNPTLSQGQVQIAHSFATEWRGDDLFNSIRQKK